MKRRIFDKRLGVHVDVSNSGKLSAQGLVTYTEKYKFSFGVEERTLHTVQLQILMGQKNNILASSRYNKGQTYLALSKQGNNWPGKIWMPIFIKQPFIMMKVILISKVVYRLDSRIFTFSAWNPSPFQGIKMKKKNILRISGFEIIYH